MASAQVAEDGQERVSMLGPRRPDRDVRCSNEHARRSVLGIQHRNLHDKHVGRTAG